MVTNPQKGDKVWKMYNGEKRRPKEYLVVGFGKTGSVLVYTKHGDCPLDINECFPSLDALLSDLRERAVPLTANDNNLEDTK